MEKLIVYPEGLRLVVEYMPSFRSVCAGIWVGAGSSSENPQNNGISHFIEHMIFKGTNKLSAFDIAHSFERLGTSVNAFTSRDCTCYYVKSIDENIDKSMDILSHIFFDSVFDEVELDRERKVILEEINMTEDSPEDICYNLISNAAFGDHPLGYSILGSKENVSRFAKCDIEDYRNKQYFASNTVVTMVGNITLEDADKIVRKYILPRVIVGDYQKRQPAQFVSQANLKTRIKDFEQSNIALSFPSIKFNDPRFAVQAITNVIVGGGMSSRLFQSIREIQGLAYSVYSGVSSFADIGSLNIYLNINEPNTEKAVTSTLDELKKLVDKGVDEDEFQKVKTQIMAGNIFSQESPHTVMSMMGKLLLISNEVFDMDERLDAYRKATLRQVNDFAREIFDTKKIFAAYVGRETSTNILSLIQK